MNILADENIGLEVVAFLRARGTNVTSITETSPGLGDAAVLVKAVEEKRILLTSDTDFGELVYHARQEHSSVILLRLDDERNANKIRVLTDLLDKYADELVGSFTVVTETNVRIRKTS